MNLYCSHLTDYECFPLSSFGLHASCSVFECQRQRAPEDNPQGLFAGEDFSWERGTHWDLTMTWRKDCAKQKPKAKFGARSFF